jgi:ubiquinol-cytochrome c reductase subunit 6
MDQTITECKESKQCSPVKHHFDECVERVTAATEAGNNKEDCVEECTSV